MVLAQIRSRLRRQEGQDLTEYALLIGLIIMIGFAAVTLLNDSISRVFSSITSTFQSIVY